MGQHEGQQQPPYQPEGCFTSGMPEGNELYLLETCGKALVTFTQPCSRLPSCYQLKVSGTTRYSW